jgi:hypothetical protein
VRLEHIAGQAFGELRHVRVLERAGRNDDLVGRDRSFAELDAEPPVIVSVEFLDVAVQHDWKLERGGVPFEVLDHLVSSRVAIGIARECDSRKGAVAPRREERQRVPALAPGRGDVAVPLEDDEPAFLAAEKMADRQAGLPCADDDHFVT